MRLARAQIAFSGALAASVVALSAWTGLGATNRQAVSVAQNFEPNRQNNVICLSTVDYPILGDGNTAASPGFCPFSGQPTYEVTLTFNRPQTEYGTRLVVWSNAGNYFNDSELRVFDLVITHVDPRTLAIQTYVRTDVQIADTINHFTPVYHDFTDAGGAPIRLYGIRTVTMRNLRASLTVGETGEAAFREVQVDTTAAGTVDVRLNKTLRLFDGNAGPPYALPSQDVIYRLDVSNEGDTAVDGEGLFIVDLLPPDVTFYNGDANGSQPGSDVVIFSDAASGLSFTPAAVGFATTRPASFAACNYTPLAGYDPAVRYLCLRPGGVMFGSTGMPHPGFSAEFRARIN